MIIFDTCPLLQFLMKNYDQKSQISNYFKEVTRKYKFCSLILAKAHHTHNLIKNKLHHGRYPCNFSNFSELLEILVADSEVVCHQVVSLQVVCHHCHIRFHLYIFKNALGTSFRNLIKNLFSLPNVAEWRLWLTSCSF